MGSLHPAGYLEKKVRFDRNLEECKGAKCRASGPRAGEGWEHQAETKG